MQFASGRKMVGVQFWRIRHELFLLVGQVNFFLFVAFLLPQIQSMAMFVYDGRFNFH